MTKTRLVHYRVLLETRLTVAMELAARAGATDPRDLALVVSLKAALARLEAGVFGVCADCGGEVSERRLQLRPHAARCLACDGRRRATGSPIHAPRG